MLRMRAAIILLILLACTGFTTAAEAPARIGIELEGSVSDETGQPLVGAVVSVFGKNLAEGALIAVTDESGVFQVDGLRPGLYRLRAYLSGFLPSAYAKVIVEEGMDQVGSVLMSLAAVDGSESTPSEEDAKRRNLAELNWLVAHGERNVLRDDEWEIPAASIEHDETLVADVPGFAFRGEFGVRAAAYGDQELDEFPGGGAGLDARVAYARIHIPTDDGSQWLVSAQMLESALSSWAGRADYVSGDVGGHRLNAGVTYGNFLYGDIEDFRPPEAALAHHSVGQRSSEWFGSVYASDTFALGSATVDAGVAYEYFGFLTESGYASPRLSVAKPVDSEGQTVLTGAVEYRVLAPGAEDLGLLSRVATADVYGPAPAAHSTLRAERTARFQLGMERRLSDRTRIGVRMFQENAHDQLVKKFSKDMLEGSGGHFKVSNRGDFQTRGVGLKLSQSFGAMEGSVGYTFGMGRALTERLLGARNTATDEEIHDVTTAVATSIDRTRTRLTAAYRFVSHPTFDSSRDGLTSGTTQDSRFNIQVFQVLPFVGWNGTSWELMVAVRNLFYDDIENSSILDEIAVIDAPRRVMGGVTVRF